MLMPMKMQVYRKASIVLAEPRVKNVPRAIVMIISTGTIKFSNTFGLIPSAGFISRSSLPISGVAPSLRTFPSSIALFSAFFIGP